MPQSVWLYDEGTAPTLCCDHVAGYLGATVAGIAPRCRSEFVTHWLAGSHDSAESLALRIARLKVRNPAAPAVHVEPLAGEIAYEQRRLENGNRGPFGVVYDGFRFQASVARLLGGREADAIHVVFTNRLLATWEPDDRRYHLRTIILAAPAIISTTGLVEAPAKPREFYAARRALGIPGGADYEVLKQQFAGRFLDHDDLRLIEVAKGYALQAVAYALTGEAFCDDPHCRLYNAHWQERMVEAQIGGRLCERHQRILKDEHPHQAAGS